MLRYFCIYAVWSLLVAVSQGGVVIGGSNLLTPSDHAQLELWLGEAIDLTKIFDKQPGDTSLEFHAAVDSKGPTITLVELNNGGSTHIVGGYNPIDWHSIGSYSSGIGAFLFNLSGGTIYHNTSNFWTTFNHASAGPTFGGGHDFHVNGDLDGGYANIGHSYGDTTQLGSSAYRNAFAGSFDSWSVGAIETFAITAVPEPRAASFCIMVLLMVCGNRFLGRRGS